MSPKFAAENMNLPSRKMVWDVLGTVECTSMYSGILPVPMASYITSDTSTLLYIPCTVGR